jgi:hypothetical protein
LLEGQPAWTDPEGLAVAVCDADTRAGLAAAAPGILADATAVTTRPLYLSEHLDRERIHTLGRWGTA